MKIKEPILQDCKGDIEGLEIIKKLKEKTPIARILWKNKEDGIVNFVSDSIVEITGYSSQDFKTNKCTYIEIIHFDDLKLVLQEIKENLQKKTDSFEHQSYRIINKSGNIRWVKDITTIIRNEENQFAYYQSLLIDITQQKDLLEELVKNNNKYLALNKKYKKVNNQLLIQQQKLQKSTEKYQLLAENISDVIWVYNYTLGRFVYISPSVLQLRGYLVEEAMRLSFLDSLTQSSKEKIKKFIPIRLERFKKGIKEEYRDVLEQVKKDGSIIWVEMVTKMRYTKDGSIEVQGVSRDITKRKLIEIEIIERNKNLFSLNKKLRESEAKYRALSENSAFGIVVHNLKGEIKYSNNKSAEILGYDNIQEIYDKSAKDFVHPDFVEDSLLLMKKIFDGEKITQRINQKFIKKDGTPIDVELYGKLIFYDNKKSIHIAFADVTEQKEIQQEIKKLSIAIEQSANVIIITDPNGNIEYVNPKFEEITGYTSKEVLNKNPSILNSGEIPNEIYSEMWNVISSGEIWKGEFCNKTKAGKIYYEKATITPIKNEKGELVNYLAIKEDITEQKRYEKELEEHRQKLLCKAIEVEEKERKRISSDLHDGIGPNLSSLRLHLNVLEKTTNEFEKKEILQKSYKIIEQSVMNLKQISKNMSPYLLDDFGLDIAILDYIKDLDVGGIDVLYSADIQGIRFRSELEIAIFRIIKELINNSLKHSKAKEIQVNIEYKTKAKILVLQYEDNGKGFDVEKALELKEMHLGIKNIIDRVNSFKGKLFLNSILDEGMNAKIIIPSKKI